MSGQDLTDPITVALLAAKALEQAGIRHALYGGLALAAYGRARETRDADLAVLQPDLGRATRAFEELGVDVQVSFEDVRFGGLSVARLAVLGGESWLGLNTVDLIRPLSDRYARAVLSRALTAPLRSHVIAVVSPEDFVLLKALSTRDVDLDDAASVIARTGARLDAALITDEVRWLTSELPDVDIAERHREILARSRS